MAAVLCAFTDRVYRTIVDASQIVADHNSTLNRQSRLLRNFDIRANARIDLHKWKGIPIVSNEDRKTPPAEESNCTAIGCGINSTT